MLQEKDTPFLEGCAEKAEPFFLLPVKSKEEELGQG